MSILRRITMLDGVNGRIGGELPKGYIEKSTTEELNEAIDAFKAWWSAYIDGKIPTKGVEDGSGVIFNLAMAYEQIAREDGIRIGLRIIHESLSDSPLIKDIP